MGDLLADFIQQQELQKELRNEFHANPPSLRDATYEWLDSARCLFADALSSDDEATDSFAPFTKNDQRLGELIRTLMLSKAFAEWCDNDNRNLGQDDLHHLAKQLETLVHWIKNSAPAAADDFSAVDNSETGLREWLDLDAATASVSRISSVAEHLCGHPPAPPAEPEDAIVYLGNGCYRMPGHEARGLSDIEDTLMQSFLESPAMNEDALKNNSGIERPGELLKKIKARYPEFSTAIVLPGRKNAGGYRVKVRKNAASG